MAGYPRSAGELGAGKIARRLLDMSSRDVSWPVIAADVLGYPGRPVEVAGRIGELLERAARLEREVERCHKLIDMMGMASAKERRIPKTKRGEHGED